VFEKVHTSFPFEVSLTHSPPAPPVSLSLSLSLSLPLSLSIHLPMRISLAKLLFVLLCHSLFESAYQYSSCTIHHVSAYNNGMAQTPPMGWSTWCTDDVCGLLDICTESEVKSIADSLVSSGMRELGYRHILLDDCWSAENRTIDGRLQPAPKQFPSGIKALADYIHERGLTLGLYTCAGTKTCKWNRPGTYGHWEIDAQTMANWTVDQVKMDHCHIPAGPGPGPEPGPGEGQGKYSYQQMSKALNGTGRPILFSLCNWGEHDVQEWGSEIAQTYRIQMDHLPLWSWPADAAGNGFGQGTKQIINYIGTLKPSSFVKQYGWMDPDFLMTMFPITMSFTDSRTEYSFWSLWSAPMLVATDVRNMTAEKQSILMNPEVIAINQDVSFTAGDLRFNNTATGCQVWSRPLSNGDHAVILFNSHDSATANVTVTWQMLDIPSTTTLAVRDLWKRQDTGKFTSSFSYAVEPHDVFFFRASVV
jgi:alpha-galactosidase